MRDAVMVDTESMDNQLVNDGQPLENSLIDSEINHPQEEILPASFQDDQNSVEMKLADDGLKKSETVDEIPEQNGSKDQILCNDGKQEQSVHVPELDNDQNEKLAQSAYLPNELDKDQDEKLAQSAYLPDELDNDQDDSEKTEVAEYGNEGVVAVHENEQDPATPTSLMACSNAKAYDERKGTSNSWLESEIMEDDEDGAPEEQAAFMKELECFYRERAMEFKTPKFYQQPLNCLKLWRAVIKLGGYDLVTTNKLWRQVGISFHPPKTCTTVSFTFRIFYEKALLDYERYKTQSGELQLSASILPEPSSVDNDANGYHAPVISSRLRRDAASRAMQGWHVQKLFSNGEVDEPASKDKNYNIMPKEKSLKSIGSMKQKRPAEMEHTMKAVRTEIGRQMAITVEDAGPAADWVKINVREAQDCFEVYALVPGLLREEVRVQSDPAGRLVITGQPEQPDNPWGITAFRKVVTLPARIDPLQTSAVVSLHGRLYVRVPFEDSDI